MAEKTELEIIIERQEKFAKRMDPGYMTRKELEDLEEEE